MTVGNAYFYGERKFFEEFTLFLSNYDNINLTVTNSKVPHEHKWEWGENGVPRRGE